MDRLAKQAACQLFIEQEIEKGLSTGKSTYAIGKEVAKWIQKLFEVKVRPETIMERARRTREALSTGVDSSPITYFVSNSQQVKIGKSEEYKLKERLSLLQCGNPKKLNLILSIKGDVEKHLQYVFNEYRKKGEWFDLPKNYCETVKSYCKENNLEFLEYPQNEISHGGARDGAGRPPKFSVKPEGGDWYQSSESPEWETPQWLFDLLDKEFHFELDVCASSKIHKCEKYFSKSDDGLKKDWAKTCWCNPPYGREIPKWMNKARIESENGSTIICLVPARPDTEWWWKNCIQGEIRFIRGRLQFPGSDTAAPFPSAVVILGPKIKSKVVWWDVQSKRK